MKVFIVNLPDSVERRKSMQNQCEQLGLEAEFFNAIHGKYLSPTEVNQHTRMLSEVRTAGELGCAMSHISLYRSIVEQNIPIALILEDDVVLSSDIAKVLADIEQQISGREIVLLNQAKQYLNRPIHQFDRHTVYPVAEADLTCSYVITRDAAETLLSFLYPVWLVADRWPLIRQYGLAKVHCLIPPASSLNALAEKSTISGRDEEGNRRENDLTWKKIKAQRPFNVKIKDILWRLLARQYYKVIKTDNVQ
ncbi:glycosyltransferase family 25 protein [Erwinia sp. V71]|uniref:glycosyltransferase family 25 protein n=1 Tax=Erwinia sp. V71 TaxID=3369424 RepID=UPI003F5E95CB